MKINKKLKNLEFEYDEETKKFLIIDGEGGGSIELNKVYAFAFMRFVVRMAQRNWLRNKKNPDRQGEHAARYEDQLEMF
jgi:hypothetical protein